MTREIVRKLSEYRRILERDADFDWTYILALLKYKLERTRKCIAAGYHHGRMKTAAEIKQVEVLLGRVVEDSYFERVSKEFIKRYGNLRMIRGKALPGARGIPMSFKFQRETPRNRRALRRRWSRLHFKADKMRRADLRLVFDKMHQNIWNWGTVAKKAGMRRSGSMLKRRQGTIPGEGISR